MANPDWLKGANLALFLLAGSQTRIRAAPGYGGHLALVVLMEYCTSTMYDMDQFKYW